MPKKASICPRDPAINCLRALMRTIVDEAIVDGVEFKEKESEYIDNQELHSNSSLKSLSEAWGHKIKGRGGKGSNGKRLDIGFLSTPRGYGHGERKCGTLRKWNGMVPEWAYTTNGAGGQDPQDERRGKDTATWGNCAAVLKRTRNSEAGKSSGEAQEAERRAVKLYGEKERLINVKTQL
ncbi:hypothetical protein B0H14DRAFT_2557387 [Mycena olivaceomarginata]|nr:hypothetical protein B0H14DRAFT_2557387 [Mycena olivaceomarginata]